MLEIKNVSKRYAGAKSDALSDVSFKVERGEFTALLGQNGAGKSTLINILAGNVKKDSGSVVIGGYDLDKDELATKRLIGIVPQEISLDFVFTVREVLRNQSGYFGIKNNERYIDGLLADLSLADRKTEKTRTLSGGMKRRLLIGKALVHKPGLLILDEPTAGVDIELRHSLYAFLGRLRDEGVTIILTTHYLEEAEKLCDRIIVLNRGKVIADDSKSNMMNTLGSGTSMEFLFDNEIYAEDLSFLSAYSTSIIDGNRLSIRARKNEIGEILHKMNEEKMKFTGFTLEPNRLEDVFLQMVKE